MGLGFFLSFSSMGKSQLFLIMVIESGAMTDRMQVMAKIRMGTPTVNLLPTLKNALPVTELALPLKANIRPACTLLPPNTICPKPEDMGFLIGSNRK